MAEEIITSFDTAKSRIDYAFNEASGIIRHSIDYAKPYIDAHPVVYYVDSDSFRSAVSELEAGVRNEVGTRINNAMNGFNIRVNNTVNELGGSFTSEQSAEFSSILSSCSEKLSTISTDVMSKADDLISSHIRDRPILQPTGVSDTPSSISFSSPNTFKYEFKNVGNAAWTGWMNIKLVDKYKKQVVVDFAPPSLPVVAPGETVVLSREISVPEIQYVNGQPRTWGETTSVHVSISTRL